MSIFSRFFGNKESSDEVGLVANEQTDGALSLQVLFDNNLDFDFNDLEAQFRAYHKSLKKAEIEIDEASNTQGTPFGLIGWGQHVIKLVGFNQPMPTAAVESCIEPSHYDAALKDQARAHKSHLLMYYQGYDPDPISQYASMALVGGFLSSVGAVVVTNESACTSFPAGALSADASNGDIVELLQTLPLAVLYCGFVKYDVEGVDGVWLRTYGAPQIGLPDLASKVTDHSESLNVFDIYNNVFSYLLSSGAQFAVGNTMQVGEDTYMKLRAATSEEYYLESEGELFVAEFIPESDINQPAPSA